MTIERIPKKDTRLLNIFDLKVGMVRVSDGFGSKIKRIDEWNDEQVMLYLEDGSEIECWSQQKERVLR